MTGGYAIQRSAPLEGVFGVHGAGIGRAPLSTNAIPTILPRLCCNTTVPAQHLPGDRKCCGKSLPS